MTNPMHTRDPMRTCHATNRQGKTCGHWAMHGQSVCHLHGGKSPQALRSAEHRMRDLVAPAISALERQINNNEFAATRYVLDWAGFKAADRVESNGEEIIRVVFEDMRLGAPALALGDGNGAHG